MADVTASGQCLGTEYEERTENFGKHKKLYRCTTCDRVFRTTRSHPAPNPNTRSHDRTMQALFDFAPKEA